MTNFQGFCISVILQILFLLDTVTSQYIIHTTGGKELESLLIKIIQQTGNAADRDMDLSPNWNIEKSNEVYDDYEPNDGLIFTKRRPSDPAFSGEYETSNGYDMGKRDYTNEAVVDLLVIVDNAIFQDFLERYGFNRKKAVRSIKRYYNLLVNLIDSRYKNIKGLGVSLRIRPVSIVIVEEKAAFDWSGDGLREWESTDGVVQVVLDPHVALKDLQSWLVKQKGLPQYDHAMAFTGYTLVKKGKPRPTSGLAYISTICQTDVGFSISVISETGGFANVGTATHELGHSLGATHDGNEENIECPAELGYIMSLSVSMIENHEENYFKFSPCSIRAFHNMLTSSQASCLFDSRHTVTYNKLPGEWLSPDKQCKHVFGPSSGYCSNPGMQKQEDICQMLWCSDPNDKYGCITKSGLHAVLGTRCDKDKVCLNGKCLDETFVRQNERRYSNVEIDNANVKDAKQHEPVHYAIQSGDAKDYEEKNLSEENKDVIDLEYYENNIKDKEKQEENKQKPKLIESNDDNINIKQHNLRQHSLYVGDRRYLAHNAKLPKQPNNVLQLQDTSTSKAVVTTVTPSPSCFEDKSPTYCRDLVYRNGPSVCGMGNIASYCCYSCNFYG